MTEVYLPWNGGIDSEDWEKVCATNYGVNMNDRHDPIPVGVEIRFDNPHAVVRVWVIERFAKVVDERTRKNLISNLERKKQMDPRNVQAPHPWGI